jgi:hypothetical protein
MAWKPSKRDQTKTAIIGKAKLLKIFARSELGAQKFNFKGSRQVPNNNNDAITQIEIVKPQPASIFSSHETFGKAIILIVMANPSTAARRGVILSKLAGIISVANKSSGPKASHFHNVNFLAGGRR